MPLKCKWKAYPPVQWRDARRCLGRGPMEPLAGGLCVVSSSDRFLAFLVFVLDRGNEPLER